MADRIVQDLSDIRLRSGDSPEATMEFLQLNSFDVCKWDDDFLSGVLTSSVYTSVSGSGATAFAVLAGTASANEWGVIRLITGTTDEVGGGLSLGLQCKGDYNSVMAVRYRVSSAANLKVEIGFRDSIATSTGTVNVLDTPSFNATNGCCWVYDIDATVDTWAAEGVKAGTASTTGETLATTAAGALPVADTYQTMVVAMMEDNAYFMRYTADGRKQGETILLSNCQTGSVNLAPAVFVQNRAGSASKNFDIDFFKVWQLRRS
jgi:hypothetical protein